MLLIEADFDARARHEHVLRAAGYTVLECVACPEVHEVRRASLILSDIPSFHWLREQRMGHLPPLVVFSSDEKAAVTACLCGAADWVPVRGDDAYLVDVVRRLLPA